MSRSFLLVALLAGCGDKDPEDTDVADTDTDSDADTDTDSDADTDTDSDADTDVVDTDTGTPAPIACRGEVAGVWADASGNGLDGSFGGLNWVGSGTPADPYALEFPIDNASASHAGAGFVSLPPSLAIPTDFSVEIWLKSVQHASYHHFPMWWRSDQEAMVRGWGLDDVTLGYTLFVHTVVDSPYGGWNSATLGATTGQWDYVAFSVDSDGDTVARLNGDDAVLASLMPAIGYESPQPSLGAPIQDENYIGDIAVVRIWGRPLSPSELLGSYEAEAPRFGQAVDDSGATPPSDLPMAWYDATPCE